MNLICNKLGIILIIISFHLQLKAEEPRYFMVPKCLEKKECRGEFSIFSKPDVDSKAIRTIKHHLSSVPSELPLLGEGIYPRSSFIVPSYEKRSNFYRVKYKNKNYWVEKSDFVAIHNSEEHFSYLHSVLFINVDKIKLFNQIGGKLITRKVIEKHQPSDFRWEAPVKFLETKIKNGKLWVHGAVCKEYTWEIIEPCKTQLDIWFRAFDDSGKHTSWSYPLKHFNFIDLQNFKK